jgi:hypothetical protein
MGPGGKGNRWRGVRGVKRSADCFFYLRLKMDFGSLFLFCSLYAFLCFTMLFCKTSLYRNLLGNMLIEARRKLGIIWTATTLVILNLLFQDIRDFTDSY